MLKQGPVNETMSVKHAKIKTEHLFEKRKLLDGEHRKQPSELQEEKQPERALFSSFDDHEDCGVTGEMTCACAGTALAKRLATSVH